MPERELKCNEHSGCTERISHLENENKTQWVNITANRDRIDQILTRVNIILGSTVTGCILLVINLIISFWKIAR